MRTGGVICLAVSLLLVGCGSSLASDDPAGYEACRIYAETAAIDDDPLGAVGGMLQVGDRARQASTPEIRAAAEPVGDQWLVDHDALVTACEANGIDVPS